MDIPWEIGSGTGRVLATGVKQDVAPGKFFSETATWWAVSGKSGIYGSADPKNVRGEAQAERANNIVTVETNVVHMVTETLDYPKAKNAGANFAQNLAPNTMGCTRIGQFAQGGDFSVDFVVACVGAAKATPEAFSNFQLKNGWTVKTVHDPVHVGGRGGNANVDWQWINRPDEGSDSPAMKMQIDPKGVLGQLYLSVKVTIRGPEGTCPYKNVRGPC